MKRVKSTDEVHLKRTQLSVTISHSPLSHTFEIVEARQHDMVVASLFHNSNGPRCSFRGNTATSWV